VSAVADAKDAKEARNPQVNSSTFILALREMFNKPFVVQACKSHDKEFSEVT
jgi:hypothetical protein